MVKTTVTVQGGSAALPTLLGQGPARIPRGGRNPRRHQGAQPQGGGATPGSTPLRRGR